MVDLRGVFRRTRSRGKDLADAAPEQARRTASGARAAAAEARRTAGAVGEVLDDRTGGRLGEAVAKGGEVADRVKQTPGLVREAFREESSAPGYRPDTYRPDPIDAPEPIDRPEPL